jgi:hypothetical protein
VRDATVAQFGPLAFPGTFAVHRLAETVKDTTQQVPANWYGALATGSDYTTASSETSSIAKRHARHVPISDSDDFSAKIYPLDPHFLAHCSVDTADVEAKSNNALHAA